MQPLLELHDLSVSFEQESRLLPAVRHVNFNIAKGSISCLVGESGCGKSLTCKAILRLAPASSILGGAALFEGRDLFKLSEKELLKARGAKIGMIFQEPMTSLNPVLTIGRQTAEPLRVHMGLSAAEARKKVLELFHQVGIPAAESRLGAFPHQLSGGMRQRVMIAMALACGPALLLADEPTTALDATVQGQILRLIYRESRERGMAVLLITHDLGVVADMADAVGVMYAGNLVEYAETAALFEMPLHPYTQGLMACAPSKTGFRSRRLPAIAGVVPALADMPPGCAFQPRCPKAMPRCARETPPVFVNNAHQVACWLYAD